MFKLSEKIVAFFFFQCYGFGDATLDNYLREYKKSVGIPIVPKNKIVSKSKDNAFEIAKTIDLDAYMAMSKEELIDELIKAKANELRAKKGYEVKGDGANKEFISLNNRNLKQFQSYLECFQLKRFAEYFLSIAVVFTNGKIDWSIHQIDLNHSQVI